MGLKLKKSNKRLGLKLLHNKSLFEDAKKSIA